MSKMKTIFHLALSLVCLSAFGQQGVSVRSFSGLATNLTVVSNNAVVMHNKVATPYQSLEAAVTASAVGDTIIAAPMTHVVSNALFLKVGSTLILNGAKIDSYVAPLGTVGPTINWGDNTTVIGGFVDLKLRGMANSDLSRYQAIIGSHRDVSTRTATNVWVWNNSGIGETDCVFNRNTSSAEATFMSCNYTSRWDTLAFMEAAHTFTFYNCAMMALGTNRITGSVNRANCSASESSAAGSLVKWYGGSLSVSNSQGLLINSAGGVKYELHNVAVTNYYTPATVDYFITDGDTLLIDGTVALRSRVDTDFDNGAVYYRQGSYVGDFTGDASALISANATTLFGSGRVPTTYLGSGTANSTTFLRGDQTWATPSSGGVTPTFNPNQFGGPAAGTNLISGYNATNAINWVTTTQPALSNATPAQTTGSGVTFMKDGYTHSGFIAPTTMHSQYWVSNTIDYPFPDIINIFCGFNQSTAGGQINNKVPAFGWNFESDWQNLQGFAQSEYYLSYTYPFTNFTFRPFAFNFVHTTNQTAVTPYNVNGNIVADSFSWVNLFSSNNVAAVTINTTRGCNNGSLAVNGVISTTTNDSNSGGFSTRGGNYQVRNKAGTKSAVWAMNSGEFSESITSMSAQGDPWVFYNNSYLRFYGWTATQVPAEVMANQAAHNTNLFEAKISTGAVVANIRSNGVIEAPLGFTSYSNVVYIAPTNLPSSGQVITASTTTSPVWTKWAAVTASGPITGVTDGSDAAAGIVGQYIESVVASGAGASLSTGTGANVTSISLTAGDWDVEGSISYLEGVGTAVVVAVGAITTSSATVDITAASGREIASPPVAASLATFSLTIPRVRISISSTTTVYLATKASFSGGASLISWGQINARRVR